MKSLLFKAVLTAALVLAAASPASARGPSFDCTRAGSWTERTICADPELSALDEEMANAFAAARAATSGAERENLLPYHRNWLSRRAECWNASGTGQEACLKQRYLERIRELRDIAAGRSDPTVPVPAPMAVPAATGAPSAPAASRAEEPPVLRECRAATAGPVETSACLQSRLKRAEDDLALAAGRAGRAAAALDAAGTATGAEEAFFAAQRAFVAWRDANCRWRMAVAVAGGAAEDIFRACLVEMTEGRRDELAAMLP